MFFKVINVEAHAAHCGMSNGTRRNIDNLINAEINPLILSPLASRTWTETVVFQFPIRFRSVSDCIRVYVSFPHLVITYWYLPGIRTTPASDIRRQRRPAKLAKMMLVFPFCPKMSCIFVFFVFSVLVPSAVTMK